MATFLELCERLAEESGGTGRAPVTVLSQVGRQKKIVNWVRDAWVKIQNERPDWFFLRAEFTATLTPSNASYSAASLSLTRWGEWIGGHRSFSLYDTAIGRTDESYLEQVPFETFRGRWDYLDPDENRPTEYAIAPDGTLRFGATPDDDYTIRGVYRKTPQILTANADVPDLPARFHDIIVSRAEMLMAKHDEAITALELASREYRELRTQMERDQLPIIGARAGRALA